MSVATVESSESWQSQRKDMVSRLISYRGGSVEMFYCDQCPGGARIGPEQAWRDHMVQHSEQKLCCGCGEKLSVEVFGSVSSLCYRCRGGRKTKRAMKYNTHGIVQFRDGNIPMRNMEE